MTGAFDGALAAGQAIPFIDHREIVRHLNGAGSTDLFADTAADTGHFALAAGLLAGGLIGAFHRYAVGAVMQADNPLRTFTHTGAAGDTLILIHFRHTVFIEGNSAEFTGVYTGAAGDTAVGTIRTAAAITGHECRPIGKAFFDSHTSHHFLS